MGAGLLWTAPAAAQLPSTRAEESSWRETSRYADVIGFLDALRAADTARVLHGTTFGYSLEGRPLPLVVAAAGLEDASPAAVRASGRPTVLVLANIHAGEVEGKEATQMLLRDFVAGEHNDWLESLVVLVAPIYNADGNERVSVLNRFRQNGPSGGVGQRPNAQGLDLNRDHMKLESPEARSLVGLLGAYDPHVLIDLHTTNGTRHAYHLTYSPPLHPDTDPAITRLLRDRLLPAATRAIGERHGWHTYYYGNAFAPAGGEPGWYTFDYRPRFNNNYLGLRNRFGILSEAYSYASFPDRVRATLSFVEAILDLVAENGDRVTEITATADRADLRGRSLPLRATFERGDEVEILMGATEQRLSRVSGRELGARLDVVRPERMTEFGTFRPTATERVPNAYYIPPELDDVLRLLELHGVRTRPLEHGERATVERFAIDSTRVAEDEFQGHRERRLFGAWTTVETTLEPGTLEVPMDQPLARLAFHLLEPTAADGMVNWNVLDDALVADPGTYPILRRPAPERD